MRTSLAIALTLAALALPVAGQERWTPVGPPAPILPIELVLDPFSPSTLYIHGVDENGPSGLWKSADAGRHWSSINYGLESPYVRAFAADPFRPHTLFAAVNLPSSISLRRSDDGGNTWTEIYTAAFGFEELVADPVSQGVLWSRYGSEVFRSEDSGATWASLGIVGSSGLSRDLAIDPLHPGTVYLADAFDLWKSTDRGATWNAAGTHQGLGFDWILPAPVAPARLYARPTAGFPNSPPYCVRSDDGGASWTPIPFGSPQDLCSNIVVDPHDSGHLWALSVPQHRLYVSHDAGASWPEVHETPGEPLYPILRVEPETGTVYIGAEQGILRSEDGGETWADAAQGIRFGQISAFLVASSGGSGGSGKPVILAQPRLRPLMRSGNGGRTWSDLPFQSNALAADPEDPSHLFAAGGPQGRLGESLDAGKTWHALGRLPVQGAVEIAVNPRNPRVLYLSGFLADQAVLFRSRDGGRTWQSARRGFPFDPPCEDTFCTLAPIAELTIDPRDPRVLFAVHKGQLFRSQDAGRLWRPVEDVDGVTAFALDPKHPGVLYAATSAGLLRSLDDGTSWAEIGDLPAEALPLADLLVDPRDGAVYAASPTRGVFRSTDRGLTWDPVSEGLPYNDVRLLALDPGGPGLYAVVQQGGIWTRRF